MKKLMKSFLALLLTLFCLSASAQFTVSGGVYYHNNPNKPLANIQIDLKDGSGNILQTTFTNQSGQYSFANVPAGTYTLSASTNLPSGGVTLQDAVLILMNVLGLYNLTPIQQLAADVDGNGVVNMNDYLTVVYGWFLYGYPFPAGDWVFTDATVIAGLKDGNNMGGSSSADVNGSYIPNYTKAELVLVADEAGEVDATEHEFINLPVYASVPVQASAFALYFEYPAEYLRIDAVESKLDHLRYTAENGMLKVVWAQTTPKAHSFGSGEPLFTIRAMTLPGFSKAGSLMLTPIAGSHLLDADGNIPGNLKLGITKVNFKEKQLSGISLSPNPVNGNTHLTLQLNTDSQVRMEVYANDGRLVATPLNLALPQGIHSLPLDLTRLSRGTYHYRVVLTSDHTQTYSGSFIK
jgi:hypothetical protein